MAPKKDAALVLETVGLTKTFGGLRAVDALDLRVHAGEISSLIGPNGAGKTTVFNVVTGIYRPEQGRVLFAGEDITGRRPHRIVEKGIARTFQNIRLFSNMTCRENVMAGRHARTTSGLAAAIFRPRSQREEERVTRDTAEARLRQVGLWEYRDELARNIPYGRQRMLEVARALATSPRLLVLDEPSSGLNPRETEDLMGFIRAIIREEQLTVLLIEHDMNVVMGISDWVTVMDGGEKIAEGLPEQIYNDPKVIEAYLGGGSVSVPVLLGVDNLRIKYGAMEALKGVSLSLEDGEIVTVLGANGAGKSTLLRAISGLVPGMEGEIRFQGAALQRTAPYDIVQRGISHAPEGRKVFATLTVEENLKLGAFTRRKQRAEVAQARDRVFDLFPLLKERRRQLAGTLSGGEQQMLAIGRALMSTPRLLLLDEPSLGLAPILVHLIFDIIREINRQGVAILLVEQNAHQALELARRGYVLEVGRISVEGTSADLKSNPRIQEAYLGGSAFRSGTDKGSSA